MIITRKIPLRNVSGSSLKSSCSSAAYTPVFRNSLPVHQTFFHVMVTTCKILMILCTTKVWSCSGEFPNIISDICWECIFPITVAGVEAGDGDRPDDSIPATCLCPRPPFGQPTPGIVISFWEPSRMVDVTRFPFCLVNLGGIKMGSDGTLKSRGTVAVDTDTNTKRAFFHVHWYMFPVFAIFNLLTDFVCKETGTFDLAWITEFDPLWNNDEWALIQNPEALIFGNPIAQSACIADCAKASLGFSFDALFWCAGCQGGIYPFTGSVPNHVSDVQSTELIVTKFMSMMHRRGLLKAYLGSLNTCGASPCLVIKKSMYKMQLLNPVAATDKAMPIGRSDFIHPYHQMRELPTGNKNYGYLIFKRRECCLTPLG